MSLPEHNPSDQISLSVHADPYYLWTGLSPETALPFAQVRNGLARFIQHHLRWAWDNQTLVAHRWYLAREEGLSNWCRFEAHQRLAAHYRPAYTALDFHELHFGEAMRRGGREAFKDPFWTPLLVHKQLTSDLGFIKHIEILVNRPPIESHALMRLFCVGWDRNIIPLSFWSYPAIEDYLRHALQAGGQAALVPSANTIRQWAHRLELRQQKPLVVTGFDERVGITKKGFNFRAFEFHGIPAAPDSY